MQRLPIDAALDDIVAAVRARRAAIVTAPPGAGKTTRVPPALVADGAGTTIVLQPRRVAARALARRIAQERGWTPGREVGWHVRHERRFGRDTRLIVATEGILTARLRDDALLAGVSTVVLDEFHERSLHADLALALAREAWRARDDLRLVVMSATLDAGPVAAYLDDAPVIDVPGRPHEVDIAYRPDLDPVAAVREVLAAARGHALVFLPGAPEIRRLERDVRAASLPADVTILPLHGGLSPDAQDAALAPAAGRKLILATNIAETSLTVDGVTDVIDTGLHKVLRADAALGIDRLETERIPADSAAQRAGRAGRTGPGRALRLWDERDALAPRREPEIQRVELAGPVLEVLAWGGDPATFGWFERPADDRLGAALTLLGALGLMREGRITERGRRVVRLPLPTRLAVVLDVAGTTRAAAAACAVLAERWSPAGEPATTSCDPAARADRVAAAPARVRRLAADLARGDRTGDREGDETRLRRAFAAAYPDRIARRRDARSPDVLLSSGHGARLARESGVRDADWLVALDVAAGARGPGATALIRCASALEPDWLEPTSSEIEHDLDAATGTVRAVERRRYGALVLGERPVPPAGEQAEALLVAELERRPHDAATGRLLRRAAFAGCDVDLAAIRRAACAGRTSLPRIDVLGWLDHATRSRLERAAPDAVPLPSGRSARLDYRDDGTVVAAVKLQELFGLADTPRIGPDSTPVVFELLAPNGRPVQTTADLRSFWETIYPEVRRELRGRYPKHPWPEDPWSADPTWRTRRRRDPRP